MARFNALPTAVTEERYQNIPLNKDCPCDGEIIETMDHVIFLLSPHPELLSSFFIKHPGHSDSFYHKLLLFDQSDLTWLTIAK